VGSVSPDAGRASDWVGWASDRTRGLVLLGAALLGVLLALFAIGRLGRGVSAILERKEATFGESILYDHAARIVRGKPLYQPLDRSPYSVAPYTPVYYLLAAALQVAFGPGFPPGRLLSFLAGLAAAALIGRLTARRARSRWAGGFAAFLFLTLGFPGRIPFFALYKEDMLGVALSLGAIATLIDARSARRLALAAVLAALAILTKQTMASAAVAGTVWLFQDDRRRAVRFAGICLGIVIATAVVLELLTGAFFANTLSANAVPFRWDAFGPNLETLVQFQAIPIALSVLYVVDLARSGRQPQSDLLVLYFAACSLTVVGMGRPGSAHNYWMELAGSTSVLATLAVWERLGLRATLGKQIRSAIPLLLLGANVAYVMVPMRAAVVPVLSFLKTAPKKEPEFDRLVERVRSEPREVLADPPDVVVLAGRPNLLELYFSTIRYREGLWDPTPLVERICRGDVGLLAIKYELESDARGIYQGYEFWPPPILAALRESMRLESQQAGRFLYVPLDASSRASRRADDSGVCGGAAPRVRP
jgi:hypothetical protein